MRHAKNSTGRRISLMSNVLLAIIGWDPKGWDQRFRSLAPQHDIRCWPDSIGNPADDRTMPASGSRRTALLAAFPNLKAIFSLGAGVDDLVADPDLPEVPVVRIVDPDLTMRMTEYVVLHVLMHHRRQRLYDKPAARADVARQPAAAGARRVRSA